VAQLPGFTIRPATEADVPRLLGLIWDLAVYEKLTHEVVATEESVTRFVSVQNHFSLLHRAPEEGVIPACTRLNMALVPFWPLAGGMLTGKYRRNEPPPPKRNPFGRAPSSEPVPQRREHPDRGRTAALLFERDHTVLDLAISWLVTQPVVATVIAGATTAEQVRSNAMAGSWKLTAADLADIDRITRSGRDGRLPRIRQ